MPRPVRSPRDIGSKGPAGGLCGGDRRPAFISFIDLERGLSPHTREGYQRDLDQCAAFVARQGVKGWP